MSIINLFNTSVSYKGWPQWGVYGKNILCILCLANWFGAFGSYGRKQEKYLPGWCGIRCIFLHCIFHIFFISGSSYILKVVNHTCHLFFWWFGCSVRNWNKSHISCKTHGRYIFLNSYRIVSTKVNAFSLWNQVLNMSNHGRFIFWITLLNCQHCK